MGRPQKKIDWKRVDQLLMKGCEGVEIAPHFDMHSHTFYDRVEQKYKVTFTEYCQQKRNKGRSYIKEKQFDKAMKGDNTMLIWVGKQLCDQKENHEVSVQPETMTHFKALMDQISFNQKEAEKEV